MNNLSVIYEPIEVVIKNKKDSDKKARFIGVKRDLLYGADGDQIVSNKELMVLVALCSMIKEDEPELYTTSKQIFHALTGKLYVETTDNRFMKKTLIPALTNLIAKKIVTVVAGIEDTDKIKVNTELILSIENLLRVDKETFIAIDKRELHRIMNVNKLLDKSISKENLLSLFVAVVGSISVHDPGIAFAKFYEDSKYYKGLVCYKTHETLRKITRISSEETISDYFKLLEQMKLLYCHSFDDYISFDDDNNPRRPRNWYARYQFKDQVNELADLWLSQTDYAIYKRKAIETTGTVLNTSDILAIVSDDS